MYPPNPMMSPFAGSPRRYGNTVGYGYSSANALGTPGNFGMNGGMGNGMVPLMPGMNPGPMTHGELPPMSAYGITPGMAGPGMAEMQPNPIIDAFHSAMRGAAPEQQPDGGPMGRAPGENPRMRQQKRPVYQPQGLPPNPF